MATLSALCRCCFVLTGFTNRELCEAVAGLLALTYTGRRATYAPRRLRR